LNYLLEQYDAKKNNLAKRQSRQIALLDFIENINLKNNSFFNYSGLNSYAMHHITPWLQLNHGITNIRDGKNIRTT